MISCPNYTNTQTLNNMVAAIKILITLSPNVIIKMHATKIIVREGDRKQEVYNWWP